jgi:hypothetical protein
MSLLTAGQVGSLKSEVRRLDVTMPLSGSTGMLSGAFDWPMALQ